MKRMWNGLVWTIAFGIGVVACIWLAIAIAINEYLIIREHMDEPKE